MRLCDDAAMPKGPQGQKRPADVVGNAVRVMQIATGEVEETRRDPALEYARKGGLKGGKSRAAKLSKEERTEIARKAAQARWAEQQPAANAVFMVSPSRKARGTSPRNRTRKT
jgi:hypothetical protein